MQQSLVLGFGSLVLALPSAASGLATSGMEPQAENEVAPDPAEELITQSYYLGGLEHSYAEMEGHLWLLPVSRAGFHGSVTYTEPAGEAIINLFSNTYWKELEFDGRWLEYDETYRVSLRGTQEMHKNFAAMIAFYARQMESTVPLQVDIVRYSRGPAPQYLQSTEAADAWIQSQRAGAQVQTLVLTVPHASLGSFQQQVVQEVLSEVEVEIAEGVALAEGRPWEVRSGTWGLLAAHPVQGGLALDLQWMRSERPRIREHKLDLVTLVGGGEGPVDTLDLGGVLELYDQRAVAVGTSVFLPDGQVLLSNFIDGEQSQGTCVAIRRLAAPDAPQWLTTTGKMKAKVFMASMAPFQSRKLRWNHEEIGDGRPKSYGAEDGRSYLELYRGDSNAIELLLADRNERLVEIWNDWGQILMRTNSYEDQPFESQVSEIDRLAMRLTHPAPAEKNYQVEIQVRNQRPGTDGILVQQNHVVQAGRELNMMLVNEHAELHAHHVQIAKRAGVYDPTTRLVLEGLVAKLQLQRITDNDLRVHFDGSYQWPVGERRIDLDTPWFAPYTQKEYGQADFQESRMLERSEEGVWQAAWGGQGEGMVLVTLKIHEL